MDERDDQDLTEWKIARYVMTHPDAGNWGPQRAAWEAVSVILNDEGAAHEVLSHFLGRTVRGLAVVKVGEVPPWMETIEDAVDTRHVDRSAPLYVMRGDE